MTKARGLRPGDLELWNRVAQTVRARDAAHMKPGPASGTTPNMADKPPGLVEARKMPAGFGLGTQSRPGPVPKVSLFAQGQSTSNPLRMDAKAHAALQKGKLAPEARLDLHGLTLAQAHQALVGFIARTHGQGKRLVLVITGKGKERLDHNAMPSHLGLLRYQAPRWLQMPPLDHHVLQVSQAHPRHGGEGALYVYLRRSRIGG